MIITTVQEVAEWVGARVLPEGSAEVRVGPDVVIDSRRVTPGCLFVALPGEQVDGHAFAVAAAEAGASAVLGTHAVDGLDVPVLVVPDVQAALGRLGAAVVAAARPAGLQVVAITGSQGKTSTKDLLAQVLEGDGPTVSPEGSFNNEIGVPLTATRIESDTRFLISEMGARGSGHIRYLTGLTPPDISVVLNVGQAHLGEFGSREGIAAAKGEIVEGLGPESVAVLNADDPLVRAMAERTAARLWFFTVEDEVDLSALPRAAEAVVRATEVRSDDLGQRSFVLECHHDGVREAAPVRLALVGAHQVNNAVAAAAAALAAGVRLDEVAARLSAADHRSAWRLEVHTRPDGVVVVNDAYNANPESTLAACRVLAELAEHRPDSRSIAVLGDMLELGAASTAEHERVGHAVADLGIDLLVAVGEYASALVSGAEAGGMAGRALRRDDKETAGDLLATQVAPGDVVLVKGSRRMGLETMAEALIAGAAGGTAGTGAAQ